MKDKKQENKKYPHLLDNKPCGQDLFEGKSHERIAKNIADIIENGTAEVVGIDGGWGAGKSNMVNLIEAELDKGKFHFFIYDAWGHQTDFQRRSILENLTSYLVDKAQIINKKKWNAKLLQLLSRKRSVGSKIVKELSAISKIGAILALSMPILVLLSNYIGQNVGKIIYWAGILILSLVILYVLQVKNMKKYGQPTSFFNVISELFLSYQDYTNDKQDNIDQSMKYETIYDEEPSSRDFKNWMKEINNDIKGHTLVIVFDNMDRLPKEKVQELWAAIHTFFADEKYSNIRVIVPFDRAHIKSAFKSEDIIKTKDSDNNNDVACYGNDFINKTFDAVYRVSPPVMSDWKAYFANRWEEAFGRKVDNKITQIYDLLSKVATPREIIAFINEFVTIKQISDNSIPDEYIALFIFGKDKISLDPQKEILQPSYLGALDFMYKNDIDLSKYISALYYQLPPEKALDIIYTDNIKQALNNGNVKQIEAVQSQKQLFFSILENAIIRVTNIPNAIVTLNACLKNEDPEHEQMIWEDIYREIKQQPINEPLQEHQKTLLTKIKNKEEYLKTMVLGFSNIHEFDVISFCNSIRQLSEMDGINPYIYLEDKEVDAEAFIGFVEQVKEDSDKYRIICKQDKLDKYLSGLNVEQLANLKAIPFIEGKYTQSLYKAQLEKLVDLNLNNMDGIRVLFDRLKEIERPIKKKLPDANIYNYFNATKSDDEFYYDLICMRISCLNSFHPNFRALFNTVLNSTDDKFVEKIAERIEYYIDYGTMLLNVDIMNNSLYIAVANRLTEKSYGKSNMDALAVIQKYDTIKSCLGTTPNMLIERIGAWVDDIKLKLKKENVFSVPIEFFSDIISNDSDLAIYCNTVAKEYLKSKSKEEWKQSILAEDKNFQLLIIIKPNSQACFDAFKELLVENIQANNNAFSKGKCNSLIEMMENDGRNMLNAFNDVRDCFCRGTSPMTDKIFDFYGEWLLKYAKLEDHPSALRTIFTTSVLDNKNNIQLMLKYQGKMVKIVEIAGEENKDFKDKIKSLLDGEYKDDDAFEGFAKAIGINKSILDKLKDSIGI